MNTHASNGRRSIRVLVVDDHAHTADGLATALSEREYTAIPAYSGEEALRVAEEFWPRVLLTDVMMPGINGLELACVFAQKFPTCRVILMTATPWASEIFIGGARLKILEKPVNLEKLFESLGNTTPERLGLAS